MPNSRGHPMGGSIRKGGLRDPVAQSIRNEQQRDAAPSKEEAKRMHREYLAEEGCEVCQEDDPDRLQVVMLDHFPDCPATQHPGLSHDPPQTVLCDEHERPSSVLARSRRVQQARNQDLAAYLVIYGCGTGATADYSEPDPDNPYPPDRRREHPSAPVECRCGAVISEVIDVTT